MSQHAANSLWGIPWGACFRPLPQPCFAHPCRTWGLSHSASVLTSMGASTCPVQSPRLRKNVQTTCSLASRLSIAVAPWIWMYEVWPPLECTLSLTVMQVYYQGIPDSQPSQLPPFPLSVGLHRHKSNALQVNAKIPGLAPRQLLSVSN